MTLPTLYKKTSTGKIQQWRIWTKDNTFITETGQVDGKKILGLPTTCKGKNTGKANETSDVEQAEKEALAKWELNKKKGYVESIEEAQAGVVDSNFVQGGYSPMLAEKFRDHSHKIVYPCYGQPKLDGHRGAVCDDILYSRTRKVITSMEHLMFLISTSPFSGWNLDGELYNHDFKENFEELSSHIRKKDPLPEELQSIVQYHVYDINIPGLPFSARHEKLKELFNEIEWTNLEQFFKFVPTEIIESKEHAIEREQYWRGELGYEGYMLRNADSPYHNKRSKDLQKIKLFQDAEFKVVDMVEGKGKFANMVAGFVCELEDRTFKIGLKNVNAEMQKEWFADPSLWKGRVATVEFLNYTNKNKVPRHGKFLRFREDI